MRNDFLPYKAKIIHIYRDAPNVKIFTFKPTKEFTFQAGQFIELAVPQIGEAPFALCSSQYETEKFQVTIQEKGAVTRGISQLNKGASVGIRGPFGQGFPLDSGINRNILIVAGGIGLAPLRSVIKSILDKREAYQDIQILYGTRCEEYRIFEREFPYWRKKKIELQVTLDQCKPQWKGNIGVITTLFDQYKIVSKAMAFVVGPPVMFKFVLEKLKKLKFKDHDIYFSLERRMHCGVGTCQHCVLPNGKYVCKDGPVFSWEELKGVPNVI